MSVAASIDAQAKNATSAASGRVCRHQRQSPTAFNPDKNNFQPRTGVAARMFNNGAARRYGLYYLGQNERGSALGFSQRTNLVASVDGNLTLTI
ncbi:MAG: hypothetical protein M9913_20710 [Bryobacteraceae bacterium]|nr:hypothetical protein [Bryobacteraceae bacterium]